MSGREPIMADYLQLLRSVRDPRRIRSSDIVERIVQDFTPFASPDPALIAGEGTIGGIPVLVFAQQKPKTRRVEDAAAVNYGMMRADGYWFVLGELARARTSGRAVVTLIDTPGADPSKLGVERRLAWAISASISAMITYPGPVVSAIIGEGGSGGALALQVADRRLIASDALFSVISPESCSAILFRDADHVGDAMKLLRPSAQDAYRAAVVDEIVDWSDGAAFDAHDAAAARLAERLVVALRSTPASAPARLKQRLQTMLSLGRKRRAPFESVSDTESEVDSSPFSERVATSAHMRAAPAVAPIGEPPVKRLVNIGVGDDGVLGLLQYAYFSAANARSDRGTGVPPSSVASKDPQILCPKKRGGCGTVFPKADFRSSGWACPICGYGERLSALQWLALICDEGSFHELHADLDLEHLEDGGYETPEYRQQRAAARAASGANEALRVGFAKISGRRVAVAASEFGFLGGTMGAVCGEKMRLICELARNKSLPLVAVTSSGGARMQEGTLGLAQMAKTNAAVLRLAERNLPYISILADPCTGGALGSYATRGTVVLAEPHALIAFAGPRVMKLAGLPVQEDRLTSAAAAAYGGIDEVVARGKLRARIARYLEMNIETGAKTGTSRRPPPESEVHIRSGMDGFASRLMRLFETLETGSSSSGDELRREFVSWLVDFSLVTVPLILDHARTASEPRKRELLDTAIARFPKLSQDALEAALDNEQHAVRSRAAALLLGSLPSHLMARGVVHELLASEDAAERRSGLVAVALCKLDMFADDVRRSLYDSDAEVRTCAMVLLSAWSPAEAEALLGEAMTGATPETVQSAVQIAFVMAEHASEGVRTLVSAAARRLADV